MDTMTQWHENPDEPCPVAIPCLQSHNGSLPPGSGASAATSGTFHSHVSYLSGLVRLESQVPIPGLVVCWRVGVDGVVPFLKWYSCVCHPTLSP